MQKEERYRVGDILKKTDYFQSRYPMSKFPAEGKLLSVKMKLISATSLPEMDRHKYYLRYGKLEKYPVFEFLVGIGLGASIMTSQFGYNKEGSWEIK